jgi:hypothetical protein
LIPSNFSQAECCNCSELIVQYSSSFWNASFCFVPTVIHLVLIYLLSKIKKYLNLESRQLFYSGYILPLIDYCCVVWGNCSNEGLNRILKLQKRTARFILDQDPIARSLPYRKRKFIP